MHWWPWCDEALQTAQQLDKPIFLSVGYSACHWCHVMERESFEDEQIADLMNRLFINIKVDREERPDIDSIYMTAVQSMTGHGGWPMSVFLTPQGEPFYGGTYFPNDERGGMPSFPRVLQSVHDTYRTRRADIATNTSHVLRTLRSQTAAHHSIEPITNALFHNAFRNLSADFDDINGGTGLQPKFPQPMLYEFLIAHASTSGNDDALNTTVLTLQKMKDGGIHDQIGGGFHRYSVDNVWLVPHFEKMLYDNAQLASLYLHAWNATGIDGFQEVTTRTLNYLQREMRHRPTGAFYSATDADSEGEEGLFFVWTLPELTECLGPQLGTLAASYWGVSRRGNFEGRNILNVPRKPETVAAEHGISIAELDAQIEQARTILYRRRLDRIPPTTDDKIITSWNALAIRAFAEAGARLNRHDWIDIARTNADFLSSQMTRSDGRLMRTFKPAQTTHDTQRNDSDTPDNLDGKLSPILGFLEDYGYLADALITLYEADFNPKHLNEAHRLCRDAVQLFWDTSTNAFHDTGSDQERLVVRPRDLFDNAQPSGISALTFAILRCAEFTDDRDLERYAVQSLRSAMPFMQRAPAAVTWWLRAAHFYANPVKQVVIVGERNDERTRDLLAAVRSTYRPDTILALLDPADPTHIASSLPIFEGRTMVNGKPTAYVCRNYVCDLPATDPEALRTQLDAS